MMNGTEQILSSSKVGNQTAVLEAKHRDCHKYCKYLFALTMSLDMVESYRTGDGN